MWDWLAGLSGAQGAVVASLLGFGTLVAGALFNAELNRRRDDRLRRQEAKSLAAALLAELQGIREVFRENANREVEADTWIVTPDINDQAVVMPKVTDKLGLLGDPELIRKLIDAHAVVRQYYERVVMLGGVSQEPSPGRRLAHVPSPSVPSVQKLMKVTADALTPIIVDLEALLNRRD